MERYAKRIHSDTKSSGGGLPTQQPKLWEAAAEAPRYIEQGGTPTQAEEGTKVKSRKARGPPA
jgi:hypothetical protein